MKAVSLLALLAIAAAALTILVLGAYLVTLAVLLRRATGRLETATAALGALPERTRPLGAKLARVSLRLDELRGSLDLDRPPAQTSRAPAPAAPEPRTAAPAPGPRVPEPPAPEPRVPAPPAPQPRTPSPAETARADEPARGEVPAEAAATTRLWDDVRPSEGLPPPGSRPGVRRLGGAARGLAARLKGRGDSG